MSIKFTIKKNSHKLNKFSNSGKFTFKTKIMSSTTSVHNVYTLSNVEQHNRNGKAEGCVPMILATISYT